MERCVRSLQSAVSAKDAPLKLAQTRLKKRSLRPEVENCADEPHHKLIEETQIINQCIKELEAKLTEAKEINDELIQNQQRLEADMKVKKNSLLIDQQKCMSKRRSFPFNVVSNKFI